MKFAPLTLILSPEGRGGKSRFPLIFWLLIAFFLVRSFIYASFVPIWQGPDEPHHYDYIHYLQTEKSLPTLGKTTLCGKVRGSLESFYFNSYATGKTPYGQGGINTNEPLVKESQKKDHHRKDLLQNQIAQHPPLYYMIGAVITWPFKDASLLTSIFILRTFSAFLGLGVLILIYLTVRLIYNKSQLPALASVAFAALNPMFAHVMTLVNNDALINFLFALFLYLLTLSIKDGLSLKRAIALGTVIGLGLLTKFFFVASIPILFLALVFFRKEMLPNIKMVSITFILPIVITSPVLIRNVILYKTLQPVYKFKFLQDNPFKDMSFVNYLLASSFVRKLRISFWSNFGWVKPRFTDPYYDLLLILAMVAFVGLVIYGFKKAYQGDFFKLKYVTLLFIAPLFLISAIAYNSYKSAVITGVVEGVQGRYLFSLIGVIGLFLYLGLKTLIPFKQGYAVFVLIVIGMLALDASAIFYYILPYFYF